MRPYIRFMISLTREEKAELLELAQQQKHDIRDLAALLVVEGMKARKEQPQRLREEIRQIVREELQHAV